MLPKKIIELVVELRQRTEQSILSWEYNGDDGAVRTSLSAPKIDICISYYFDTIREVGVFRIDIFDYHSENSLRFSTTEEYNDFNLVRALYDSAQASGLNFKF